jgi:hypothetical protein
MHYGLMGEPGEGWPLRPAYQVLRLYTHTIAPGWRAVPVEGDSTNVALAAVQGPDGELTIMALNHSKAGQAVSVARLPPGGVFHRVFWTAAKSGQLQGGSDVTCVAGLLEMTLPPQSLTALADRSNVAKDLGIDRSPTR